MERGGEQDRQGPRPVDLTVWCRHGPYTRPWNKGHEYVRMGSCPELWGRGLIRGGVRGEPPRSRALEGTWEREVMLWPGRGRARWAERAAKGRRGREKGHLVTKVSPWARYSEPNSRLYPGGSHLGATFRGQLAVSGDVLIVTTGPGGMPLASSGWRLGMPLNILQCTGQPPAPQHHPKE